MDHLHATLKKASESVSLDPHFREGFRRTLETVTDGTPVAAPVFRLPRAFAWALAALVVASTGATVTYASSRALPGDALYSLKVDVFEPIESLATFSAEARAGVAVTHLERRFREAAELAARGELAKHDTQLARLAERDMRAVQGEDYPLLQTRVDALVTAYTPLLRLRGAGEGSFATAVRVSTPDDLPDAVARVATQQQLAIAQERRQRAAALPSTAAVSRRIAEADRLSIAANEKLAAGAIDEALALSGAAAQVATEADLFAALTTSTDPIETSTTSTSTATTTSVKVDADAVLQIGN